MGRCRRRRRDEHCERDRGIVCADAKRVVEIQKYQRNIDRTIFPLYRFNDGKSAEPRRLPPVRVTSRSGFQTDRQIAFCRTVGDVETLDWISDAGMPECMSDRKADSAISDTSELTSARALGRPRAP